MNADAPGRAQPVSGALLREAVGRLLYGGNSPPPDAVARFIRNAPHLGIDLDLIAAVVKHDLPQGRRVRQACMPVVGAGRTVMLFLSGPGARSSCGTDEEQASERADSVIEALRQTRDRHGDDASLVQGLAEPEELWAMEGYLRAGLGRVAELVYLSRPLRLGDARLVADAHGTVRAPGGDWPQGVSVRALRPAGGDEGALRAALERSYEGTLDCPELAGLRRVEDIVDSHRAVGEFSHELWWLIERGPEPVGCVLLNRCPDQGCVELVYIGLSPPVRGLGLGTDLLASAIAASASLERELRCAVDLRNEPARRMYAKLGFHEVGRRIAFVARVQDVLERKAQTF